MSQFQIALQEVGSPTSKNPGIDLETLVMAKSPKSSVSKTEVSIIAMSLTKSPTLQSLKLPPSPLLKIAQRNSVAVEESEEDKSIKPRPPELELKPVKPTLGKPEKASRKEIARAQEQDYDYRSQLLVYIPENLSSMSTSNKMSNFNTFNQLSRSTRNSHQKKLEDILDLTSDCPIFSTQKQYKNSKIARIDAVNQVLELNKLQKKSYVYQIETEKKNLVLPLIKKLKEDKSLDKKMPKIKILPSRKNQGANVIDVLTHHANVESGNSKLRDMKIEEQFLYPLLNYRVFWQYNMNAPVTTWKPGVREGHTLTTIGRKVVLYGGIQTSLLNDIVIYDPVTKLWSQPKVGGEVPMFGRHGHTACEYKKTLIIFGGEHEFSPTLNFRECLNDVRMFNPELNEWKYLKAQSNQIDPRRYHAAAIQGRNMYVYGGVSNEGYFLKDVWAYDLRLLSWSEVEIENNRDTGVAFHAMCACFQDKTNTLYANKEKTRAIEEGFYVFGGKDGDGKILNTLKYLSLSNKTNQWKYPVVKGEAPDARYNHSMLYYEPMAALFIYGGRNDTLYGARKDICLNDIKILNLEQMSWSPVSVYGNQPEFGRNHHAMANFGSSILIFGGMGTQKFMDDEILVIELNQAEVKRQIKIHGDNANRLRDRSSFRSSSEFDFGGQDKYLLDDQAEIAKPTLSFLPIPSFGSNGEMPGKKNPYHVKSHSQRIRPSKFVG